MEQTKPTKKGLADVIIRGPLRVVISLIVPVIAFLALRWSFIFLRDSEAPKLLTVFVALVIGVFGVWILYFMTDDLVSRLPRRMQSKLRPFVFVGPGLVILSIYLIYPTINTFYLSFLDAKSKNFIGMENYIFAFTDPVMLVALRNNAIWLILVTFFSVAFGLLIAVMADRIGKWEPVAKSLIFLPMAISFVGASVIWRFIYFYQPPNRPQIGLLNALVLRLGGEPVGWLIQKTLEIGPVTIPAFNTMALLVIMIWLQTGFAMVVISAAVKGVPTELLEAARIDGANEIQIFFRVIIPHVRGTLITIATTIAILVLKIFDIVFVMTSGQLETEVVANRMYNEMFKFRNFGRGSALAVLLLLAVTPFMISNVRSLREQRS